MTCLRRVSKDLLHSMKICSQEKKKHRIDKRRMEDIDPTIYSCGNYLKISSRANTGGHEVT